MEKYYFDTKSILLIFFKQKTAKIANPDIKFT